MFCWLTWAFGDAGLAGGREVTVSAPVLQGRWHLLTSLRVSARGLGAWGRQMEIERSFPGASPVPWADVRHHAHPPSLTAWLVGQSPGTGLQVP